MKVLVFSVYDSKTESYSNPVFDPTIASSLRNFAQACNDPETNLFKYPGDYTLFQIGEFDPSTGKILPLNALKNLGLAIDFKKQQDLPLSTQSVLPINNPVLKKTEKKENLKRV